ncbi:MAG: sensor domain-containing diguanylate cyclase [Clostridiales bacterium]|nr:sensor domain-containing diguanylate cyclase [Clostridiales bacterium]
MDNTNYKSSLLKQELESNDLFRKTFLNSQIGVLFFDSDALLIDANDYMFRLFGIISGDVSGKKFCDVFLCSKTYGSEDCKSCSFMKSVKSVIASGNPEELNEVSHEFAKNGRKDTVWFNLRAIPYMLSETDFIIVLLTDITKRKYLESNLKNLGITDGETLLYYRKFIVEQLEILTSDASLTESPLSIVLMDIDKLRNINEDYGSDTGDEIISRMAKIISQTMRHSDFAGRYGGEEFLVLLPDTKKEGASVLTERIMSLLEKERFGSMDKSVTFSSGILEINHADINVDGFLANVNFLLQKSKKDHTIGWCAASVDELE